MMGQGMGGGGGLRGMGQSKPFSEAE